jgi:hypothetical protein
MTLRPLNQSTRSAQLIMKVAVPAMVAACFAPLAASTQTRDDHGPSQLNAPIKLIGAPGQLSQPIDIIALSNTLVVLEGKGPTPLFVYSRSDGRLLAKWGTIGAASSSLLGPQSLESHHRDEKSVWVHDGAQSRMVRVPVSPPFVRSKAEPQTIPLPSTLTVFSPAPVGTDNFLVTGYLPNTRLALVDKHGQVISAMGAVPGNPSHPISIRQEAYRSKLAANHSQKRVVLATRHADRLDIFSMQGTPTRSAPRPFSFEPAYEVAQGANGPLMTSGADLRFGYVDVAASSERIIALFSGVRRGEGKGTAQLGRELHVTDWDGRSLRRFSLPRPAIAISVPPDGKEVYVLHALPTPVVAVYRVP